MQLIGKSFIALVIMFLSLLTAKPATITPTTPRLNANASPSATYTSIMQARQAGEKICANPPATFQPLAANQAMLAYYGLPIRPKGDSTQWQFLVQHAKHRFCNKHTNLHSLHAVPHLITPDTSTVIPNDHWSGFVDLDTTKGGPRFGAVFGRFSLDCTSQQLYSNGDHVEWIGLGGAVSQYLWQAGWDDVNRDFFDE